MNRADSEIRKLNGGTDCMGLFDGFSGSDEGLKNSAFEAIKAELDKQDMKYGEDVTEDGEEQIIRMQTPKLAICTYHKAEHLWEIPAMILQLNPAYKIYFRHHDKDEMETVCYAVS